MSNFLSCGPVSLSNSSEYERPEQPPPLTPILRYTLWRFWLSMSCFTCFNAVSVSATAMAWVSFPSLGRVPARRGFGLAPLLLVVLQRGLDGVLGQHRAVDLDRRQLQLVDDVRVLDLGRLAHRTALEPLGGQARRGDGAAAAERLELGVLDHAGLDVDLDLQLHHVAALGCAHQARSHSRGVLGEGPHVARVVVVVDYLIAVGHVRTSS